MTNDSPSHQTYWQPAADHHRKRRRFYFWAGSQMLFERLFELAAGHRYREDNQES